MTKTNETSLTATKPVWFITGCSTDFGRELAKHLLELGYRAVVTARDPEDVKDLSASGDALILKLDVTDQGQINATVKAAEDQGPPRRLTGSWRYYRGSRTVPTAGGRIAESRKQKQSGSRQ
jgi:NAD(P)-dependent dehydrogenase (short-subunit alcohol dehydrogenase family)